jgi:hypothetical protein
MGNNAFWYLLYDIRGAGPEQPRPSTTILKSAVPDTGRP